ncbi:MAG TPA: NADH:ubiquinone reductase (Na(+)-transporting) subunit D [Treponema sp.]|nr:MAG: NADH:ubiquinone reductase (Na(+)-transporting) subunit D [Treponema sp. GWA1_62_8]OHE67037.1 MAG: NADH:ubiquinone reductase (Na(+)-transporting) subunit D [Treponema sp. GWC1_61_84]OHE73282.1 MAG: NADH:ubiquinone reductase (Na(+)-transporting) subunit D [Treponema sp. RIFOXYC1_FULL_61_9]HCM27336.1 NADH:ubiquinone reductase (Na(+)-transporting) subunit D [Treponema sp.]
MSAAKKRGKAMTVLIDNLWWNNPVFIQILGICSTLAVTNNLTNTFIMTVGVSLATAFSSWTLAGMNTFIPNKVRMIVQVLVISFYVIIIDIVLRAYMPDVSRSLGPYVGLIITNCIIMGRAEAFARSNPPLISFWDGLTSGFGYMAVLMAIAAVRELLGFGSLFGIPVLSAAFGDRFVPWTIMIMAPSAFFLLALAMWGLKSLQESMKAAPPAAGGAKPQGSAK